MNIEQIKALRQRITIPMQAAIALFRENKGDILAAEQAFHNKNIKKICDFTACVWIK